MIARDTGFLAILRLETAPERERRIANVRPAGVGICGGQLVAKDRGQPVDRTAPRLWIPICTTIDDGAKHCGRFEIIFALKVPERVSAGRALPLSKGKPLTPAT